MKLLIVEDDAHVIRGIQQNMDWERLGITQVCPALGSMAARKILEEGNVDVMICDIEMPQETGLDLLEWIRRERMNVQTVFLTSYAKFEYAQRAIKLDSIEYILKPVDYGQLEKALALAVEKAWKYRQSEVWKENHHYWEQNRENVTGYFWKEVLRGKLKGETDAISRRIEESGLSYVKDSVFLPVVLQLLQYTENEQKSLEEIVKRLDCSFYSENQEKLIWKEFCGWVSEHVYVLLLGSTLMRLSEERESYAEELLKKLDRQRREANLDILCGVGMWSIADLVYEDMDNIYTMLYETPRNQGKIVKLCTYEPMNMFYEAPDLEGWREMMKSRQTDKLMEAVEKYLAVLNKQQKLSTRNLQQLGMDLTQMVYAYLSSLNIYAHVLFDNEENNRLYAKAALSSRYMMQYFHYLLSKAGEYQAAVERPNSIIHQVKQYMDEHFQENISREELSRRVFLNPDYLSRLFKKETGYSISGYLIQKRINLAKELLSGTDMPVSVIASQAGYDNFAYFTKVFKEKTGMSPNVFRKEYRTGKT